MTVTGRNPCPHCGRPYSMAFRAVRGVREGSAVKVRDIDDHACPAFRPEPALAPILFTVTPERTAADMAYSLNRYRRAIR